MRVLVVEWNCSVYNIVVVCNVSLQWKQRQCLLKKLSPVAGVFTCHLCLPLSFCCFIFILELQILTINLIVN